MHNKVIKFLDEHYIDTGYYQNADSLLEGYTVEQLDKMPASELINHIDVEMLIDEEGIK